MLSAHQKQIWHYKMAKKSKSLSASQEPSLFSQESSTGPRLDAAIEDNSEGVEDDVITVGNRLRMAREERSWSLHEVAEKLRLRARQIQALEDGNYHLLPGQTFVIGFLRSYANLLDLDAVAIVDLYKQEHSDGLGIPSLTFPEPTSEGRIPGTGMLLGTLMLSLVLIAGWFIFQESNSFDFERVAEVPSHLAEKIESVIGDDPTPAVIASAKSMSAGETENVLEEASETNSVEKDEGSQPETSSQDFAENQTFAIDDSNTSTAVPLTEEAKDKLIDSSTETVAIAEVEKLKTTTAVAEEANTTSLVLDSNKEQTQPDSTVLDPQIASTENKNSEPESAPEQVDQMASTDQITQIVGATTYPQAVLDPAAKVVDEEIESPLPRTFGVGNTTARVVLRARAETWIEVKPGNGAPYLSRVLKPGDVYMAPDLPNLKMTTGNAGGLEIRVDGNAIASLGGNGKILRDISLVADSLLDGSSISQ